MYIKNDNNWVYQIKTRSGKSSNKLLGIKCPHCGYFTKASTAYEDWAVDAQEHITYCNPAHRRAVARERF